MKLVKMSLIAAVAVASLSIGVFAAEIVEEKVFPGGYMSSNDGNGSAFNLKTNDSEYGNYGKANLSANADGKDVNQTYSYMFHKKMNNLVNTFTNVAPTVQNAVFLSAFKDSNMLNSAKTTHNINLQVVDATAVKLKNNPTGGAVFVYMNTESFNLKLASDASFTGKFNDENNMVIKNSFVLLTNALLSNATATANKIAKAKTNILNDNTFVSLSAQTGTLIFTKSFKNNIENGKIDKYAGATNIFDLRDNTIMTANTATNMNNNTENVKINADFNVAYFTNTFDRIGAAARALQDGDKKSIGMPLSA